jgi:hypothetical protein
LLEWERSVGLFNGRTADDEFRDSAEISDEIPFSFCSNIERTSSAVPLALQYVQNYGGLMLDIDYPYFAGISSSAGACTTNMFFDPKVSVDNIHSIVSGEADMVAYVLTTGPLMVTIGASSFSTYVEGIMTVCDSNINHTVQAVGVTYTDHPSTSYWKIRVSGLITTPMIIK